MGSALKIMLRGDETELLTVLHEGARETPRWGRFLSRLRRRLSAEQASLLFARNGSVLSYHAPDRSASHTVMIDRIWSETPDQMRRLRTSRIYTRDEVIGDSDGASHLILEQQLPRRARVVRLAPSQDLSVWLAVFGEGEDFTASDGALMSGLVPHLQIMATNLIDAEVNRLQAMTATQALARLGVSLRASAPGLTGADVRLPVAEPGLAIGAGIGHFDVQRVSSRATGSPEVLAMQFGLTRGEAHLAIALAQGHSLAEAADILCLTVGTARNYSKRLFAKTHTRGQPELVRCVLTSVAMLADPVRSQ